MPTRNSSAPAAMPWVLVLLLGVSACLTATQARKDIGTASQAAQADLKAFIVWSEQHQGPLSDEQRKNFRERRANEAEPAIGTMRTCFGEINQHMGRTTAEDVELATRAAGCEQAFHKALSAFMQREGGAVLPEHVKAPDGGPSSPVAVPPAAALDGGVHGNAR